MDEFTDILSPKLKSNDSILNSERIKQEHCNQTSIRTPYINSKYATSSNTKQENKEKSPTYEIVQDRSGIYKNLKNSNQPNQNNQGLKNQFIQKFILKNNNMLNQINIFADQENFKEEYEKQEIMYLKQNDQLQQPTIQKTIKNIQTVNSQNSQKTPQNANQHKERNMNFKQNASIKRMEEINQKKNNSNGSSNSNFKRRNSKKLHTRKQTLEQYVQKKNNIKIKIFQLINDLGSNLQFQNEVKVKEKLLMKLSLLLSRFYINPINMWKVVWDILVFMLNIGVMFSVSIDIFFCPSTRLWKRYNYNTMIQCFWTVLFIDMLCNFVTGYYEKGVIQKNIQQIARNYAKKYLYYDMISLISMLFTLHLDENTGSYFCYLVYLRFSSIILSLKKIENLFFTKDKIKYILYLLQSFSFLLLLVHFASCFYFGIGKIEWIYFNDQKSWIILSQLKELDWVDQYIQTYYLMSALLMGEGVYNTPQNRIEQCFYIFIILLTVITCAYVITTIGQILNTINLQNQKYQQDLAIFNRYAKKKQLSFDLQIRSRNFLQYLYKQQQDFTTEEEIKLLNKLPKHLNEEIMKISKYSVMEMIQIINNNFSNETISKVLLCLEEQRYSQNEILDLNKQQNKYLYYLHKGELQYIYIKDGKQKEGPSINEKSIFGEYEFFTNQIQKYNIKSNGFSIIYRIDRNRFTNIISQNQNDLETFCQIKDMYIQQDYIPQVQCQICDQKNHELQKCIQVHFSPLKQKIILEQIKNDPQERCRYKRNDVFLKRIVENDKTLSYAMRKQLMVEHIIHKFELELDLNIDEQELYLQLQNQNYSDDDNDEIFSNSFNNEIDLIPSQNIQVNSQNVNQTSTQSYQKLQKSIENKAQINDKNQENVAKKQQQFQEKDHIMTLLSLDEENNLKLNQNSKQVSIRRKSKLNKTKTNLDQSFYKFKNYEINHRLKSQAGKENQICNKNLHQQNKLQESIAVNFYQPNQIIRKKNKKLTNLLKSQQFLNVSKQNANAYQEKSQRQINSIRLIDLNGQNSINCSQLRQNQGSASSNELYNNMHYSTNQQRVQRQKNSQDSMTIKNNNSKNDLYEKQDSVVSNGLQQFQKSIFKNFDYLNKSPIKYEPSYIIKEDNIDN